MVFWADERLLEERRRELEREAAGWRLARLSREGRSGDRPRGDEPVRGRGIGVRWGLEADKDRVVELLELNGMPRWVAFEERFVVAERDGEVLAVLRYRTESKRLVLGLLVADPWGGERELAAALYAGAGELAREMGAREVAVPAGGRGYPAEAGYRRRGGGWRLDVASLGADRSGVGLSNFGRDRLPVKGWRRAISLFGIVATPFFRAFVR